jgi:hypothetical protein
VDLNQCACSGKNLARLLRPAILALLVRGETHGYDLVRQLGELAIYAEAPPDTRCKNPMEARQCFDSLHRSARVSM